MEPNGIRIPGDALLQYEYLTPIGECLFPCSTPTDRPRGQMPACRWLPAPVLELRCGRSPWRPRFPRPGQVAPYPYPYQFPLHTYIHPRQYRPQFRLATASTSVLDC